MEFLPLRTFNFVILPFNIQVKVTPLQAMKAQGDVDARYHIFAAMELGSAMVSSPTCSSGKGPVHVL